MGGRLFGFNCRTAAAPRPRPPARAAGGSGRRRGFKSNYFTIHEIISTFLPLFTGIACVLWRRAPTVTVAVNPRAETQSLDWYKQNLSGDLPANSSSSFGMVPSMFFSPGPPLRLRLLYLWTGVPVLGVLEAEPGLIVVNSRGRG